eukprot:SAG31_NODE_1727_length_7429_cov_4.342701_6_plen_105_part_00
MPSEHMAAVTATCATARGVEASSFALSIAPGTAGTAPIAKAIAACDYNIPGAAMLYITYRVAAAALAALIPNPAVLRSSRPGTRGPPSGFTFALAGWSCPYAAH